MSIILNLDTSTQICSVAISSGLSLLGKRESLEEKSHSSLLSVFIEELLQDNDLRPAELDAVAVSAGPGSYTGLRIGVSTAKGIAYGGGIPLIGIGTLEILVSAGLNHPEIEKIKDKNLHLHLCPMIDARRMEVYTALYDSSGKIIEPVSAKIIDENSYSEKLETGPVVFFGNGAKKCMDTISHPNAMFVKNIEISAEFMIPLANQLWQQKKFEDVAYFEPYYLKDFIATIPKNRILPGK